MRPKFRKKQWDTGTVGQRVVNICVFNTLALSHTVPLEWDSMNKYEIFILFNTNYTVCATKKEKAGVYGSGPDSEVHCWIQGIGRGGDRSGGG